jgi:drug/metabolite transporter (DMT)-like permease
MLAAFLIVASCATGLVEGILIKKYNAKHDKGGFIFTAMVSLFSMLFFVITDTGGFDFRVEMLPYGLLAGMAYCVASLLTFIALTCGPFAISMLIISYSGVFLIGYGLFFLNEAITPFKIAGILLIFLSLFLNRSKKKDEEKKASLKWLICITVSLVGSGMLGVIQRMQQIRFENKVTNEFMIVTLGFSATVLFIIGLIKDGKDTLYVLKNGAPYFSAAGISNGLTNFLSLAINLLLAISISSPIKSGAKIIFTFAVSKLIFKEKLLKRQVAAVLVGAVALVLLNIKI